MVKLIKLQGDSDKSETQIRNIFNDGIVIPPNSKIGLRSCRVNFLNIQDFENFTLPTDTAIEVDYHVGDVSGSSPAMFKQKVIVPSKDASGNQINYESAGQLLTAIQKQSNATYSNPSIVISPPSDKYKGFHNIWDLTQGTLNAGRSEFLTYSLADQVMGFSSVGSQFVKQSPDSDTNITRTNGSIGITASTASPLAGDLNVEGQFAIPLVNTVMSGNIAILPANDPAAGDDCFVFAAKKGSGELSSHPVLWGWGISKDHNTDRRYAMWVNNEKYFFPDSAAIQPQVDDQIECRKFGDKVRFDVNRGGTNLPLALGSDPVASTAGSDQLTVTVPSGSGAHVGVNVVLSGLANIERPAQALVTDGVATAAGAGNTDPLTLTFASDHHLLTGETFTMVSSAAVDGVAIGAGSSHTVASVPSATTITIAMPSGQTATTGGVTGGGSSMTIKADLVMISSVFLNKSHVITAVPTATTITIAHDTTGTGATPLLFTQTGGGASGLARFPITRVGKMISGNSTHAAQSGTVPVLTSDSLDPQIVRWQVTADKACGFKVGGTNSASLTYQATDSFGQASAVGLTINTTLTFPRGNPIGSYIGFTDTVYSNIGAPSVITSDQPAIGRNAYPAILVQSLKGLNLDSYAGVQDAPNKPISFFDVIVPQSVSTISNMIYEPNNIAMLDLHNARPIELKDMEVQFARDDTGEPLQFFGQPTVVLELEEGRD